MLSTYLITLHRYEIFKGLLGAFDEERRRFRARLREQELLMQVCRIGNVGRYYLTELQITIGPKKHVPEVNEHQPE